MTQEEIDQLLEAYALINNSAGQTTPVVGIVNPHLQAQNELDLSIDLAHAHGYKHSAVDKEDDYNPWFIDDTGEWHKKEEEKITTKKVECECGAHKVKDSAHSTWCALYEA